MSSGFRVEMAVDISTQRWKPIPWAKNAWNWNVKLENMPRTRASITCGSVRVTHFYNTSTTLDRGNTENILLILLCT